MPATKILFGPNGSIDVVGKVPHRAKIILGPEMRVVKPRQKQRIEIVKDASGRIQFRNTSDDEQTESVLTDLAVKSMVGANNHAEKLQNSEGSQQDEAVRPKRRYTRRSKTLAES